MKSFCIAFLMAVASVDAIKVNDIPQSAIDKVYQSKKAGLIQATSEPKKTNTTKEEPEIVSWDQSTLPLCPSPERTMMDDGKTHVVKYPYVGATCKSALVQMDAVPWANLEHCPDFNERRTLKDGKTTAIAWPAKGATCQKEGPLLQQVASKH